MFRCRQPRSNGHFFVERSMGSTCYLRCYIINTIASKGNYDTIGFQSPFLDDVFRYKYEYLDMVRKGINLALEPKDVYMFPFIMNGMHYEFSGYRQMTYKSFIIFRWFYIVLQCLCCLHQKCRFSRSHYIKMV